MNKNITIKLSLGLLGAALSLTPNQALARIQNTPTEISVKSVFLPAHGYDDNDHIVMVITGELPHVCYTLGETKIEKQGHVIRVHQYAWLRTTGFCGSGDVDPDLTSPFESEISLGQLDTGNYKIEFLRDAEDRKTSIRNFNVSVAETADIDDFAYAAVSDIVSPKMMFDSEQIKVTLQGSFNLTCEHLADSIRVERQEDVFVIMPIIERDQSKPCVRQRTEFQHELDLGKLPAGKYLVHVRAMSGKAVNRVLDIYRKP